MLLHPVIRILCFLILVTFLARMHLPEMLILMFFFFIFALKNFTTHITVLYRFVVRLRWFWISIILLYSLMPLGAPDTASQYETTQLAGLIQGLIRCLALLIIIMYFVLLVHPIPVEQLQQSWYWLMRPLKLIGMNSEVFSLRIALTFSAVRELQAISERPEQKFSFRQLPQRLFEFIQVAVEESAKEKLNSNYVSHRLPLPGFPQWLAPVCVLLVLLALVYFQPILLPQFLNW